jgi:hypothetical protein
LVRVAQTPDDPPVPPPGLPPVPPVVISMSLLEQEIANVDSSARQSPAHSKPVLMKPPS